MNETKVRVFWGSFHPYIYKEINIKNTWEIISFCSIMDAVYYLAWTMSCESELNCAESHQPSIPTICYLYSKRGKRAVLPIAQRSMVMKMRMRMLMYLLKYCGKVSDIVLCTFKCLTFDRIYVEWEIPIFFSYLFLFTSPLPLVHVSRVV